MTPVLQPTGRRDEIGLILSGGFPEFDLLGFLLHKRVRTVPLLGGVLGVIGHEVSDVILFDEVFQDYNCYPLLSYQNKITPNHIVKPKILTIFLIGQLGDLDPSHIPKYTIHSIIF